MPHTLNGFLFAAVGFVAIDLLNRNSKRVKLSPLYLVMVAFCFSMTIGVLWEFFECGMGLFFAVFSRKSHTFGNTFLRYTARRSSFHRFPRKPELTGLHTTMPEAHPTNRTVYRKK